MTIFGTVNKSLHFILTFLPQRSCCFLHSFAHWDVKLHHDMLPLGVIHFDLFLCLYCILSSHPGKGKPSALIAKTHTGPTWTWRDDTFSAVGFIVVNYLKLDTHQIALLVTVKRCMFLCERLRNRKRLSGCECMYRSCYVHMFYSLIRDEEAN